MFEQTLLTQPPSARKTGALAASFLAQSCVLGVLLVGPLLFTHGMPLVIPNMGLPVFVKPLTPERPPEVEQPITRAPSGESVRPAFQPLYVTRVPTGPIREEIVGDVPELNDQSVPRGTSPTEIGGNLSLPPYVAVIPRAEIVKPVVTAPEQPAKPTAINSGVLASKLVTRVLPQYPALARQMRISGAVRLLAIVGKDGHVQSLRVIEGHPMLREAALNAVKQWVYSPTYLSGQPIEVEAAIEVNFNLN
jgi:periplasmic protein TonB